MTSIDQLFDFESLRAGQVHDCLQFRVVSTLISRRSHGSSLCFFTTRVSFAGSFDDDRECGSECGCLEDPTSECVVQIVLARQNFKGSDDEFRFALRWMALHAVVEMEVKPGKSLRGEPSLYCVQFVQLIRCAPHPEVITAVVQEIANGNWSETQGTCILCSKPEDVQLLLSQSSNVSSRSVEWKETIHRVTSYLHNLPPERTRIRRPRLSSIQHRIVEYAQSICNTNPRFSLCIVPDRVEKLPVHVLDCIMSNVPTGLTEADRNRRLDYLKLKKIPQIEWMLLRIQSMVEKIRVRKQSSGSTAEIRIWDVGGGRGDLAMAIAATVPDCHIRVLDVQESSLLAGKALSATLGLATSIQFDHMDFLKTVSVLQNDNNPDLIVALHACGGLSDAILAFLSVHPQCEALVCTCCFTKLASLAQDAWSQINCSNGIWKSQFPISSDLLPLALHSVECLDVELCRIAECVGLSVESNTAMHAINTLRLLALQKHESRPRVLQILEFPAIWSVKNQVLYIHIE